MEAKVRKSLGTLHKETRTSTDLQPRRYLAGLSFGISSTVLTQILDGTAEYHSTKKSSSSFEPLVVHVDTDLSPRSPGEESPAQRLLAKYRQRYPHVSFDCVHLSKALSLKTVDWSALPLPSEGGDADDDADADRLRRLFDALPSVTSRADILRQLVRHILIDTALQRDYSTLLLGHSTSALAALTLAEVANGRGFSVPSQVNDGPHTICTYGGDDEGSGSSSRGSMEFPIYFPLREVFKNEIATYMDIVPSLADMKNPDASDAANVVSHKDLSIEEVMQRYFDGVEGPYSGIVANVVRTTAKLDRVAGAAYCRLCGMTLDEHGDSRWAGDLGHDSGDVTTPNQLGKLCYGCRRSVSG